MRFLSLALAAFGLVAPSAFAGTASLNIDGAYYFCADNLPDQGVSVRTFAGTLGCQPQADGGMGRVSNRCECVDNAGPDLMQVGYTHPPYQERWRTKIGGWDNGSANWQTCWAEARSSSACNGARSYDVARRCECIDNDGPDLMQIGFDVRTAQELWRTKIGGWDTGSANWQTCWSSIQTTPACR